MLNAQCTRLMYPFRLVIDDWTVDIESFSIEPSAFSIDVVRKSTPHQNNLWRPPASSLGCSVGHSRNPQTRRHLRNGPSWPPLCASSQRYLQGGAYHSQT